MKITMNAVLNEEDVVNPALATSETCGITPERAYYLLTHVEKSMHKNTMVAFMELVPELTSQDMLYLMSVGYTSLYNMDIVRDASMIGALKAVLGGGK
jgi:hypothetical protein